MLIIKKKQDLRGRRFGRLEVIELIEFDESHKRNHKWLTNCDSKPSCVKKTRTKNTQEIIYNGIDRVDNEIGYEIGNVVPCCKMCNISKHAYHVDEFYEWVVSVYNNLKSKEII